MYRASKSNMGVQQCGSAGRRSHGFVTGRRGRYRVDFGDVGLKYRFIDKDDWGWRPSIAIAPQINLPSGSEPRGRGAGRAIGFIPARLSKDFNQWTVWGGGGPNIDPGPDVGPSAAYIHMANGAAGEMARSGQRRAPRNGRASELHEVNCAASARPVQAERRLVSAATACTAMRCSR
jgi:hypothetical protein